MQKRFNLILSICGHFSLAPNVITASPLQNRCEGMLLLRKLQVRDRIFSNCLIFSLRIAHFVLSVSSTKVSTCVRIREVKVCCIFGAIGRGSRIAAQGTGAVRGAQTREAGPTVGSCGQLLRSALAMRISA